MALLAGLLCLLALSGCGSAPDPRPYNVIMQADATLGSSTVRVDLVGVTESDWDALKQYPVSEYWQPGNIVRQNLNKTSYVFGEGQPRSQELPKKDPIWSQWLNRGSLYLLMIADLPGIFKDQEGTKDFRRLLIPLDSANWPSTWFTSTDTIHVEILAAMIRVETKEVPKSKK